MLVAATTTTVYWSVSLRFGGWTADYYSGEIGSQRMVEEIEVLFVRGERISSSILFILICVQIKVRLAGFGGMVRYRELES